MKCIAAAILCAGVFTGAAVAEPKTSTPGGNAPTTWAPPEEIAPKTAAPAEAPAPSAEAPAAAQPANAAPVSKTHAERQKDCRAQADAKGLHGKERKHFKAECLKG
ncbi:MAG: PsiF family protein [Methylocystis sp.]